MVAGKILETISDGDWHSLEDVAGKLNASVKDIAGEVITLSQFGVVVYDEMAYKVKLSPWILNVSERGGSEGRKSAVGSMVLPPQRVRYDSGHRRIQLPRRGCGTRSNIKQES